MTDWKLVSYIMRSSISRKILEILTSSKKPLPPKIIAKEGNLSPSNISTRLIVLRNDGLVECVNPEDKKWRFYKITEKGLDLLKEAKRMK